MPANTNFFAHRIQINRGGFQTAAILKTLFQQATIVFNNQFIHLFSNPKYSNWLNIAAFLEDLIQRIYKYLTFSQCIVEIKREPVGHAVFRG